MAKFDIPKELPLISTSEDVLLPGESLKIPLSSKKNLESVKHLLSNGSNSITDSIVGIVFSKNDEYDAKIGVAGYVAYIMSNGWPRKSVVITVVGMVRLKINKVVYKGNSVFGHVTPIFDSLKDVDKNEELSQLLSEFKKKSSFFLDELKNVSPIQKLKGVFEELPSLLMIDLCASLMAQTIKDKLEILEALDLRERLKKVLSILNGPLERLGPVTKDTIPNHKTMSLIRVMGMPRMNVLSSKGQDIEDIEAKIKNIVDLPEYAKKVAENELQCLKRMSPFHSEYSVRMNYLDFISSLPWGVRTEEKVNIIKAQQDLDKDHYGLQKIKKRVLEYLAVRLIKKSGYKAPILCFVGPPGVGKTSIGRSIANTIGRKFYRISLGGVCQESEVRGHSRTYVGALPGRILQAFKSVKVKNPVILLDEVDKLSKRNSGDPTSALLEVLDPEQNSTFVDHYLNIQFDLSETIFIATANSESQIPPALRDRMEIIHVSGYTLDEKKNIAVQFLFPKLLLEHGLQSGSIVIPDDILIRIISRYTQEAGVRNLERKLAAICRFVAVIFARHIADNSSPPKEIQIDKTMLAEILGPALYNISQKHGLENGESEPGIAIGLSWSPSGGDITVVEASRLIGGSGNLVLTGMLGNVMMESTKLAINWFRSVAHRYGLCEQDEDLLSKCDIHIHFPAGAVSKEGPSAGITTAVALVSLFSGIPVVPDLAMTGEITLSGKVLPVGGIKEKVIAAHRANMRKVMLPRKSRAYMDEIPNYVLESIEFIFVTNMDEVIDAAFSGALVSKKNNAFVSKL